MTPMRQAFITALKMIQQEDQVAERLLVDEWLIETMDRARDAEESGAAAKFAAAAIIYLDARQTGVDETIERARENFDILTRNLVAVMLLRRGRVKGAATSDHVASV